MLIREVSIAQSGQIVTDHLWLDAYTIAPGIDPGSLIEFNASVKSYVKGYHNPAQGIDQRSVDYKLAYPSNLLILE